MADARTDRIDDAVVSAGKAKSPPKSRQQLCRAIHWALNEMTSVEEKLIGRISAQLTRAVEEANQAYEFAPGSYTAGVLNALLSAQQLVRELASATGCYCD
jgi:hypothetical protein